MIKFFKFLCLTTALLTFVSTGWGQVTSEPEPPILSGFIVVALPNIWTGAGSDDLWSNPDNWLDGIVPNGSFDEATVGAIAPAVTDLNISLASLTVDADGVIEIGAGLSFDFTAAEPEITTLTNAGAITALDSSDFQISGTVDNTGSIDITSTGGATDLEIAAGGATLIGGGTVTLSGTNAGINESVFGTQTLTIADQAIQGFGNICLLYTSPSPRDLSTSRMPSSA